MVDGRKFVVGVVGEIGGELSPVFITEAELGLEKNPAEGVTSKSSQDSQNSQDGQRPQDNQSSQLDGQSSQNSQRPQDDLSKEEIQAKDKSELVTDLSKEGKAKDKSELVIDMTGQGRNLKEGLKDGPSSSGTDELDAIEGSNKQDVPTESDAQNLDSDIQNKFQETGLLDKDSTSETRVFR
ncbi:hypothetical protein OS493_037579 [Desmophyllum pertusum]|uniref:Uncharacterized protein n=1 Tax=Desmophyllum pertusum TaxID=174260 RepID=A0A9W9YI54_9CNID|nr:hypothetical protein OS493_037579 [Desmophyllum pertusum]